MHGSKSSTEISSKKNILASVQSQPTFLTTGANVNDENVSPERGKSAAKNTYIIDSPQNELKASRTIRRQNLDDVEADYIRDQITLKKKRQIAEEKLKQGLIDKINFTGFDQSYYKDLPIQPGVSFFKWLTPKTNKHSRHAHATRMPGLNAIQLTIPEIIVYSDRYMGIPDTWVGTDPKDGCVVKRRVNTKDWRSRFAKKALNGSVWGIHSGASPTRRKRKKNVDLNPDVIGMLKIANRTRPQTTNTRILTPHNIEKSLERPIASAALCAIQGFVRCKGPRAVVYRVVWRKKKNPYAFCIVNEVDFANVKKKRHDDAPMTDDAIEQLLTRLHCATSDVTNRGSLPALNVFEILGKAIVPIVGEIQKIVKYVEKKESDYGRLKFEEFVGDFIKSRDDEWVFINCKAFKLEKDCYDHIRDQISKEQAEEANGMTGDFANMARQSSIKAINKKNGLPSNGHERRGPKLKSKKAALLASNGKLCFFCEQKYMQGDILPLAKVGGSPRRMKRRERNKNDNLNKIQNSMEEGNTDEKPQLFERKVESFGYNMTERMMIDTIKILNRRGINPFCFSLNLRRLAGASMGMDNLKANRANVGESSGMHKVCRFCFEIHNSQRSLVALSRQFASALGVPHLPLSLLPGYRSNTSEGESKDRYYNSMMQKYSMLCGPGKNNKASKRTGEGAASSPPAYSAYARPSGMPPPPPNSLKPGNLEWVDIHKAPVDAKQYRIIFFWHELEDVLPRKLPKVHAELQYKLVEHVHRVKIDLSARGTEGYADDCIPLKQLRINYFYASPKALQSYLFTHKIELKLILTVGEGSTLMTAEGTGAMYLSSFLSSGVGRFGQRGYRHKSDMRISIATVPLGEVIFRVSVGIVGDNTHVEDNLLDRKCIRFGKQETQHGNKLFWLPENYHDSSAIPESWMGAITHGVKSIRDMKAADAGATKVMTDEEKAAYEIQQIENHLVSLLKEFLNATPVTKYATKKADLLKFGEMMSVVQNMLDLRKQISSRGASRPLAKAMTNMINDISWEKNMNDQKAELNANSLRRDSANVALAHAHTEIEFREQLKKLFDVFLTAGGQEEGKRKKKRFNRTGSMDGRTRGHSRMNPSQESDFVKTNSLKVSIDKVCRTKTYTVTPLKTVPEVSKEDGTDSDKDILVHSPTGVSRPKQLSDEQIQKWTTLSHLLDETLARGTEFVTWAALMEIWNSRKREISLNLSLEMSGVHIAEDLPEAGPEAGGDHPYDEHTVERRWIRLRACMRIFEHVSNEDVQGTKISKNNHPLQYIFVDDDNAPSQNSVVDVGELRAYIAELATPALNRHLLDEETIRERVLDVVRSHPKEFILKEYPKDRIEEGVKNICFAIDQINRCSQSLCQSLQKNKLTDHLNRVYDGVASGSITWPEFLWLCENSVEKAVVKARQDAARKESTSVVEDIFFSADSYPSQKEKQLRVDEVSLALEFERIESSFSETHELYVNEKEKSNDDDASKPVYIDEHLHAEEKQYDLAMKDRNASTSKKSEDASMLIENSVQKVETSIRIQERVISVKPLPDKEENEVNENEIIEQSINKNAEESLENVSIDNDKNNNSMTISPISATNTEKMARDRVSTDDLILGDEDRINMEYINNENNDVPDFMHVTMSKRKKKSVRPNSAPTHRRKHDLKPKSETFQKKANRVAQQRIAALEGVGGGPAVKSAGYSHVPQRAKTNALLARRRDNLKKQLEKSNKKARKQRDQIASQLYEMRAAMAKQLERSNREYRRKQPTKRRHQHGMMSNTYHEHDGTKFASDNHYNTLASSHDISIRKKRPQSAPSKRRSASGRDKKKDVGKPSLSSTNGGMIVIDSSRKRQPRSSSGQSKRTGSRTSNLSDVDMDHHVISAAFVKFCKIGDLKAVENILNQGAKVDTRLVEPPRRTLLQEAARTGRTRLANLLLNYGASVSKKDDDGCNALYWAYANQHDEIVELLLDAQAQAMGIPDDDY